MIFRYNGRLWDFIKDTLWGIHSLMQIPKDKALVAFTMYASNLFVNHVYLMQKFHFHIRNCYVFSSKNSHIFKNIFFPVRDTRKAMPRDLKLNICLYLKWAFFFSIEFLWILLLRWKCLTLTRHISDIPSYNHFSKLNKFFFKRTKTSCAWEFLLRGPTEN